MGTKETIRDEDKKVLRTILLEVSSYGDDAKEVAEMCGCSVQKVISVAKRYEGRRFKGGTIGYSGPQNCSMAKSAPGIKNPRTGICERIASEIYVTKASKR